MATTDSTADAPRFAGKHARDHYKMWLVEDARRHIADAAGCPALDTADLYIAFIFDPEAAYAQLARLTPKHLVGQALAMTSYL